MSGTPVALAATVAISLMQKSSTRMNCNPVWSKGSFEKLPYHKTNDDGTNDGLGGIFRSVLHFLAHMSSCALGHEIGTYGCHMLPFRSNFVGFPRRPRCHCTSQCDRPIRYLFSQPVKLKNPVKTKLA